MSWDTEAAAAVDQERLVDGENRVDMKIGEINGRVGQHIEGEEGRGVARLYNSKKAVLVLSTDDLVGLKNLWNHKVITLTIVIFNLISLTTKTTSPSLNFCSTVFRTEFFVELFMIYPTNHSILSFRWFLIKNFSTLTELKEELKYFGEKLCFITEVMMIFN